MKSYALLGFFIIYLAGNTSVDAYSGSVLSQSKTTFIASQQADVTVTVKNTGSTCEMAVRAVNIPSGWAINNGSFPSSNWHYLGNLSYNSTKVSPAFKITAPVSSGSSTLTWELWRGRYYFGFWYWDEKLTTRSFSVTVSTPTPPGPPQHLHVEEENANGWVNTKSFTVDFDPGSGGYYGVKGYRIWANGMLVHNLFTTDYFTFTQYNNGNLHEGNNSIKIATIDNTDRESTKASLVVKIDTQAPALPSGLNPSGNVSTTRPTLRWNSVSGAHHYHVKVWWDNALAGYPVLWEEDVTGTSKTLLTDLVWERNYLWAVTAIDAAGNESPNPPIGGNYTPIMAHDTTAPTIPGKPDLAATDDTGSSNIDNITNKNNHLAISWVPSSDPQSGILRYEWKLDEDPNWWDVGNGSNPSGDLTGGLWGWGVIFDGGHTLYVRAVNGVGTPGNSSSFSFTIDTQAPALPGGLNPSGNVSTTRPTLRWNSVSGAHHYYVKVWEGAIGNPIGGPILWEGDVSGTSKTLLADLVWERNYLWAVTAIDAAGNESPNPPIGGNYTPIMAHDSQKPVIHVTSHEVVKSNDTMKLRIKGEVSDNIGAANCHVAIRYDDLDDWQDNFFISTIRTLISMNPLLPLFIPLALEDAIKTGPIQAMAGVAICPLQVDANGNFDVIIPNCGILWDSTALELRDSFSAGHEIMWTVTVVDPGGNYNWPSDGDYQPGGWRTTVMDPFFGLQRRLLCINGGRGSLTYNPLAGVVGGQDEFELLRTHAEIHNQRFIWWNIASPNEKASFIDYSPGDLHWIINNGMDLLGMIEKEKKSYLAAKRLTFRVDLWNAISDPWLKVEFNTYKDDQIKLEAQWTGVAPLLDAIETIILLAKYPGATETVTKRVASCVSIGFANALYKASIDSRIAVEIARPFEKMLNNDPMGGLLDLVSWYGSNPTGHGQQIFASMLTAEISDYIHIAVNKGWITYPNPAALATEAASETFSNIFKVADVAFALANLGLKLNDTWCYGLTGGDYIVLQDVYAPMVESQYIGPNSTEVEANGCHRVQVNSALDSDFAFEVINTSGNSLYNVWFCFDLWESDLTVIEGGDWTFFTGFKKENTKTPISDLPPPEGTGRIGALDWEYQKNGDWVRQIDAVEPLMIPNGSSVVFRLKEPYILDSNSYDPGPHVGQYAVWYNGYPGKGGEKSATGLVKYHMEVTDSTAPPSITHLGATGYENDISIWWERVPTIQNNQPINRDLKGYYIYRSNNSNGSWDASNIIGYVDARLNHNMIFSDKEVDFDISYYYRVAAVDSGENISSLSPVVSAKRLDGPRLYVAPTYERIDVPFDQTDMISVSISIRNTGVRWLGWNASLMQGSGTILPSSGIADDESSFSLEVPAENLTVGTNTYIVQVIATDPEGGSVENSPMNVTVEIIRAAGAFGLLESEFAVHTVSAETGSTIVSGQFVIRNIGNSTMNWSVSGSSVGMGALPTYNPVQGTIEGGYSRTVSYTINVPRSEFSRTYYLKSTITGNFSNSPLAHTAMINVETPASTPTPPIPPTPMDSLTPTPTSSPTPPPTATPTPTPQPTATPSPTLPPTATPSPTITPCVFRVISPNGGESWTMGTSAVITWADCGLGGKVTIKAYRAGKPVRSFRVPNIGSYTVPRVPVAPLVAGCDFRIEVWYSPQVNDRSDDDFCITIGGESPTPTPPPRPTPTPSEDCTFQVISPNGGEKWAIRQSAEIVWEDCELGGQVTIKAYRAGKLVRSIKVPNTGSYTVPKVPGAPSAAGCNYRIEVWYSPKVNDRSDDDFCITTSEEPTVTPTPMPFSAPEYVVFQLP